MGVLFCALACWAGISLASAPVALAADTEPTLPGDGNDVPPCIKPPSLDVKLLANLVPVGLPIAGSSYTIDATTAKLAGPTLAGDSHFYCDTLYFPITKFEWKLFVPQGQSASISFGTTLRPSVNLGGPGKYKLRLVVCPNKCELTAGGKSKSVGPFNKDITIDAVSEMTIPPETEPLLPTLGPPANPPHLFTSDERAAHCAFDAAVAAPQWVVAEPFNSSAPNYRLVEGGVESNRVSEEDDFLNHDSQDQKWDVLPDPPYKGLAYGGPSAMEMELETGSLPEQAGGTAHPSFGGHPRRSYLAPTGGDRASNLGFWIHDCGHDPFKPEIHPVVGMGLERPRAVDIPATFRPGSPPPGVNIPPSLRPAGFPGGMGADVKVPGIVTDLWFNRQSGEITSNCSNTGLHQPPFGPGTVFSGSCILAPHRLGKHTFNVYLPRDPRLRAVEVGLNPPPVPLYVAIQPTPGLPAAGPDPTIVVKQSQDGATWLEVTVDLTGAPGITYARRVSAAWAYPQTENWGAKRWNVRLDNLVIHDDAEFFSFDDGDWRFFFNTNNRDREWTRVFSCDGCVDDGDTKDLNERTGARLGPDLTLFPGQRIFVHTGGFDEETWGQDIGTIFDRVPQAARKYSTGSSGGVGSYTLNYTVSFAGQIRNASLTPETRALLEAYTARSQPACVLSPRSAATGPSPGPQRAGCGGVAPARKDSNLNLGWHPDGVVLGKRLKRRSDLELFESEPEERTLHGISASNLKRQLGKLRAKDPKRLNAFLAEIREELARVPARRRNDYGELVAKLDNALPTSLVGRALPSGFRKDVKKSLKILSRR